MTQAPSSRRRLVDVVVVSYNSARTLRTAVESVRSHNSVDRVIVVDNASFDGTRDLVGELADVAVLRDGNAGFAAGVNAGLAHSAAPYVLLLNPDAILGADALSRLLEVLETDPRVAAVGPLLVGGDGHPTGARRFSTVANRLLALAPVVRRWRSGRLGPEYPLEILGYSPVVVDYLWGAALLVRRSILQKTQGLDERFFLYGEDEDLGRAIHRLGMVSVLIPDVHAAHVGGESTAGDDGVALARLGHSLLVFFGKWEGSGAAYCFAAGFSLILVLHVLRSWLLGDAEVLASCRRALCVWAFLLTGASPRGPFGTWPSNCAPQED